MKQKKILQSLSVLIGGALLVSLLVLINNNHYSTEVVKENKQIGVYKDRESLDDLTASNTNYVTEFTTKVIKKGVMRQISGSVAIRKKKNLVFNQAAGFANFANSTVIQSNTMFKMGSYQNALTKALIIKELDQKKQGMNTSLKTLFPGSVDPSSISIKDVINGLSSYRVSDYTKALNGIKEDNVDTVVDTLDSTVLENNNSEQKDFVVEYLQKKILEKITHQKYDAVFNQHFIKSLNLVDVSNATDSVDSPNIANGYKRASVKKKLWHYGERIDSKDSKSYSSKLEEYYGSASDILKIDNLIMNGQFFANSDQKQTYLAALRNDSTNIDFAGSNKQSIYVFHSDDGIRLCISNIKNGSSVIVNNSSMSNRAIINRMTKINKISY